MAKSQKLSDNSRKLREQIGAVSDTSSKENIMENVNFAGQPVRFVDLNSGEPLFTDDLNAADFVVLRPGSFATARELLDNAIQWGYDNPYSNGTSEPDVERATRILAEYPGRYAPLTADYHGIKDVPAPGGWSRSAVGMKLTRHGWQEVWLQNNIPVLRVAESDRAWYHSVVNAFEFQSEPIALYVAVDRPGRWAALVAAITLPQEEALLAIGERRFNQINARTDARYAPKQVVNLPQGPKQITELETWVGIGERRMLVDLMKLPSEAAVTIKTKTGNKMDVVFNPANSLQVARMANQLADGGKLFFAVEPDQALLDAIRVQ